MLDWFLILTPLLVLPIVALFVFVGCTLNTNALVPSTPVTFTMIFDPALGGEDASFDLVLDIVPDDHPESPIHEGIWNQQEPDDQIDERFLFVHEVALWPKDYTVTCRVFAYLDGDPVNEGDPIVQSAPCRLALPNGHQVTFDAPSGSPWFTSTGCD